MLTLTKKENLVRLLLESRNDFHSYFVDSTKREIINRNQKPKLTVEEQRVAEQERAYCNGVKPALRRRGLLGLPAGGEPRGFRSVVRESTRHRATTEELVQLTEELQRHDEREYRRRGSYADLESAWPRFRDDHRDLAAELCGFAPGGYVKPPWELDWRIDLKKPRKIEALRVLASYLPDLVRVPWWVVEADEEERAQSTWLDARGKGSDPEALDYRNTVLAGERLMGRNPRELAVVHRLDEKTIAGLPEVKLMGRVRRKVRDELIRQAYQRTGDRMAIAREYGVSKPSVDRAIRRVGPRDRTYVAFAHAISRLSKEGQEMIVRELLESYTASPESRV